MKTKYKITLLFSILGLFAYSQVNVSEFIQKSKIATSESNALYFVDFWATWCIPCRTAKEQLTVLQREFPDNFYIVSLTKENPLTVERFLEKKPTKLAIAIDYNNETFSKHAIEVLPNGILFNAKGEELWRGSSADLTSSIIYRYLRQEKAKINLTSFFNIITVIDEKVEEYIPQKDMEIKLLNSNENELTVVDNDKYLKVTGRLKQILSYLAKIYKNQIIVNQDVNKSYEIYIKKPYNQRENLAVKLVNRLKLNVKQKLERGEVLLLDFNSPTFWDTNQIDWGINNSKYLISTSDIKADNVSLKDMSYQLANVLELPVIIAKEDSKSYDLHDWEMHYEFFELMQSTLKDNYNIDVIKKDFDYKVYHISSKN